MRLPTCRYCSCILRCLFTVGVLLGICDSLGNHVINKRALLFPQNTVLQLTYGMGVPIVFRNGRQLVWNHGWQQNYDMPYNLSNFKVSTYYARSGDADLDISRETLYVYIMNTLDNLEVDGEQCLLRAICEVARTPFHITKKNSILEKIAQFIFTPTKCCNFDKNLEEERNITNSTFEKSLLQAQNLGLQQKHCALIYTKCPVSIIDLISQKHYVN